MTTHEDEIASAVEKLGLSDAFSKCSPQRSSDIVAATKARFVADNPRVWWLGFGQPSQDRPYTDPSDWERRLTETLPPETKRCWLILESEQKSHPVYEVEPVAAISVLKECSFFEYYLVHTNFDWIIADTDHNQFILAHPLRS